MNHHAPSPFPHRFPSIILLLPTAHLSRYSQSCHLPHLLLPPSCFPSPRSNHITHFPPHPHSQSRSLSNTQKPNILRDPFPLSRRKNPAALWFEPQLYGSRDCDLECEFRNGLGGIIGDLRDDFDESGVLTGPRH